MIFLYTFVSIFVFTNAESLTISNLTNYGTYVLQWRKFEICSGPKLHNLTIVSVRFLTDSGQFNVTYLNPTRMDMIKVTVTNIVSEKRSLLYSYRINKPCDHYVVGAFVDKFKIGGKGCVMKKGTLSTFLNFTQIFQNFFGPKFFYGQFELKILTLAAKGNIMCMVINVDFLKK